MFESPVLVLVVFLAVAGLSPIIMLFAKPLVKVLLVATEDTDSTGLTNRSLPTATAAVHVAVPTVLLVLLVVFAVFAVLLAAAGLSLSIIMVVFAQPVVKVLFLKSDKLYARINPENTTNTTTKTCCACCMAPWEVVSGLCIICLSSILIETLRFLVTCDL